MLIRPTLNSAKGAEHSAMTKTHEFLTSSRSRIYRTDVKVEGYQGGGGVNKQGSSEVGGLMQLPDRIAPNARQLFPCRVLNCYV